MEVLCASQDRKRQDRNSKHDRKSHDGNHRDKTCHRPFEQGALHDPAQFLQQCWGKFSSGILIYYNRYLFHLFLVWYSTLQAAVSIIIYIGRSGCRHLLALPYTTFTDQIIFIESFWPFRRVGKVESLKTVQLLTRFHMPGQLTAPAVCLELKIQVVSFLLPRILAVLPRFVLGMVAIYCIVRIHPTLLSFIWRFPRGQSHIGNLAMLKNRSTQHTANARLVNGTAAFQTDLFFQSVCYAVSAACIRCLFELSKTITCISPIQTLWLPAPTSLFASSKRLTSGWQTVT